MLKKTTVLLFTLFSLLFINSAAAASKNIVTEANPIVINEEAKEVTILAKVNGKYLTENTRHGIIFKGGKYGDKPIFISYATAIDFYHGLVKIGAKAGDNMTPENRETTHVQGDKIKVMVTWEGAPRAYKIEELIVDSNNNPFDFRFGGNLDRATIMNTGCVLCLDSCPVGIVSNATYTYGAVEKRSDVVFHGNANILPKDGTSLTITFSVDK